MKKEKISNGEQAVHMFALRYSFGRKTYAFGLVIDEIMKKVEGFDAWQLNKAAEEIREAIILFGLDDWDAREYVRAADKLMEIAKRMGDD